MNTTMRTQRRKSRPMAIAAALAMVVALAGCSSDDEATDAPAATQATATAPATANPDAGSGSSDSDDFCVAMESLEESLFLVDADSVEELETWFAEVEAAYADVQQAAPEEYADDLQTFAQALGDFRAVLESEGVNVRALLDASAELAVAGEILAEKVNCPTV